MNFVVEDTPERGPVRITVEEGTQKLNLHMSWEEATDLYYKLLAHLGIEW